MVRGGGEVGIGHGGLRRGLSGREEGNHHDATAVDMHTSIERENESEFSVFRGKPLPGIARLFQYNYRRAVA